MWVVGTLILLAAGVALILFIGWTPRVAPSPPLWEIPGLNQTYTGIVGTLAGFSVASAIFLAGLDDARTSPAFATVIGMLLIAFLILVLVALMYASAPNIADGADSVTQAIGHVLANTGGCLGFALSWLALVPLLELIGLPALAEAFTWLLLIVALAAGVWVALFAYRLTPARTGACVTIPVLSFVLLGFYRLVAVPRWPALWPATDAALHYAFVAFGVVFLMFICHLGLLIAHGNEAVQQRLRRDSHRIALAYSEAYSLAVGLTWFAVAMP